MSSKICSNTSNKGPYFSKKQLTLGKGKSERQNKIYRFKVFDFTLLAAKGDAKFYENSRKLYFGPIIGPFCPIFLGNQLPSLFPVSRFLSLCKILEPNKQIRRKTGYVGTYGQARNHRNSPAGGTKRHKKKLRSPMSYRT